MMLASAFRSIASGFAASFGGPFADASAQIATAPTLDAGGSITAPGTVSSAACQAQIDAVTAQMRLDADFQERDVRLIVIGIDALTIEDRVIVGGTSYALRSVTRDPVGIGFDCRARAA